MAKGVEDTAFYRWHRLVALNEVGGDPTHVRRPARGVPRLRRPAAAGLAGHDDDAVHPRHQALRGRPGAAGRPVRAHRRSGPRRSARWTEQALPAPLRRGLPGPGDRVPDLADARRHLGTAAADRRRPAAARTWPRRPARPSATPRGPARTRLRRGGRRRSPRPCWPTRRCSGDVARFGALLDPAGPGHRPGPEAGAADHAGRPRRLPGLRDGRPVAGRPGQPPRRRLRRPPRAGWRGWTPGEKPRDLGGREAARHLARAAAAPRPPGLVRRAGVRLRARADVHRQRARVRPRPAVGTAAATAPPRRRPR